MSSDYFLVGCPLVLWFGFLLVLQEACLLFCEVFCFILVLFGILMKLVHYLLYLLPVFSLAYCLCFNPVFSVFSICYFVCV